MGKGTNEVGADKGVTFTQHQSSGDSGGARQIQRNNKGGFSGCCRKTVHSGWLDLALFVGTIALALFAALFLSNILSMSTPAAYAFAAASGTLGLTLVAKRFLQCILLPK